MDADKIILMLKEYGYEHNKDSSVGERADYVLSKKYRISALIEDNIVVVVFDFREHVDNKVEVSAFSERLDNYVFSQPLVPQIAELAPVFNELDRVNAVVSYG